MQDDVMDGWQDARIVMQRCRWTVAVDVRWLVDVDGGIVYGLGCSAMSTLMIMMTDNNIGDEGAKALSGVLGQLVQLKELYLYGLYDGCDGGMACKMM